MNEERCSQLKSSCVQTEQLALSTTWCIICLKYNIYFSCGRRIKCDTDLSGAHIFHYNSIRSCQHGTCLEPSKLQCIKFKKQLVACAGFRNFPGNVFGNAYTWQKLYLDKINQYQSSQFMKMVIKG